jgi:hypothetical protein
MQFPGIAHRSARRKKQSLHVTSIRFAKADPRGTIGTLGCGLKGRVHEIDAISEKNLRAVAGAEN